MNVTEMLQEIALEEWIPLRLANGSIIEKRGKLFLGRGGVLKCQ